MCTRSSCEDHLVGEYKMQHFACSLGLRVLEVVNAAYVYVWKSIKTCHMHMQAHPETEIHVYTYKDSHVYTSHHICV
jgi:hypothetical protein